MTINDCLYNYRVGHSSLSTNLENIKYFEKIVNQEEKRMNYIKKNIKNEEWNEYFTFSYLYYCQLMMVVGAYNSNRDIYDKYRIIVNDNKLYNKKYKKYYFNNLSVLKYIFFKYIGSKSYQFMKMFIKILY